MVLPGSHQQGIPDQAAGLNLPHVMTLLDRLAKEVLAPVTQVVTGTGILAPDFRKSSVNRVLLTENVTEIKFPFGVVDRGTYALVLEQDATGNHTVTGWNARYLWPQGNAPVPSTAPSARDVLTFFGLDLQGTLELYGVIQLNFGSA